MCLMLCEPLDWQYSELPSSASDAVLCSVLVRKMWDNQIIKNNKKIPIVIDDIVIGVRRHRVNFKCTKFCNKTPSGSGIIGRGHLMIPPAGATPAKNARF